MWFGDLLSQLAIHSASLSISQLPGVAELTCARSCMVFQADVVMSLRCVSTFVRMSEQFGTCDRSDLSLLACWSQETALLHACERRSLAQPIVLHGARMPPLYASQTARCHTF
jgi:hypothetical protein